MGIERELSDLLDKTEKAKSRGEVTRPRRPTFANPCPVLENARNSREKVEWNAYADLRWAREEREATMKKAPRLVRRNRPTLSPGVISVPQV